MASLAWLMDSCMAPHSRVAPDSSKKRRLIEGLAGGRGVCDEASSLELPRQGRIELGWRTQQEARTGTMIRLRRTVQALLIVAGMLASPLALTADTVTIGL